MRKNWLFWGIRLCLVWLALEGMFVISLPLWASKLGQWRPASFVVSGEELSHLNSVYNRALGWRPTNGGRLGERKGKRMGGRPLMLVFGDSFVFGDEVTDDETWAAYLSELSGRDIINFGVGGYGPDQALLRYRELAGAIEAPYVAIGVTRENINRIVNVYRRFYIPRTGVPLTKPRFYLSEGVLQLADNPVRFPEDLEKLADAAYIEGIGAEDYWFKERMRDSLSLGFPYALNLLKPGFWQKIFNTAISGDLRPDVHRDLWEDEGTVNLFKEILRSFGSEVRARGAKPVLIFLPNGNDVGSYLANGQDRWIKSLAVLCQSELICFDAIKGMAEYVKGAGLKDLKRYWINDGHLSAEGNRVVATLFHENLEQYFIGLDHREKPNNE